MNKYVAYFFVALAAFSSCNSNDYSVSDNGLEYKFYSLNEKNKTPQAGDKMLLKVKYFSATDSLIFDSREISDKFTMEFATPTDSIASVNQAYAMMHEGDSASFKIDAEYFYSTYQQGSLPAWVKSGEKLRFEIKLEKIYTKEEFMIEAKEKLKQMAMEEELLLAEYIQKNYPDIKPQKSGLYFIETKSGKGDKPRFEDEVVIHYKASYINGEKIYSSFEHHAPLIFKLNDPSVWPGLSEGISLMNKGCEATLILPSELAAGIQGEDPIPPCSTIIVEALLIDFKSLKM